MKFNYLNMIWDVKIYLAKIKDGKGKELILLKQEKFANKNPAKMLTKKRISSVSTYSLYCMKILSMKWKEFVSDYFTFTRKERIAYPGNCLMLVIFVFSFTEIIFNKTACRPTVAADTAWIAAAKKLEIKESDK